MVVFKKKWLFSGKLVVFGQSGCIREKSARFLAKVVVLGMYGCMQKRWLYMGKSCCIRLKVIVVG